MRKYLLIILLFTGLAGMCQLSPRPTLAIPSPSTTFVVNQAAGTSYFDASTNSMYTITSAAPGSATLNTTAGKIEWSKVGHTHDLTNYVTLDGTQSITGAKTFSDGSLIMNGTRTTILKSTATGSNKTITFPDATGTVALGSGTAGYVPYFTSANVIGNSPIFTDGTNVGIGTTNPGAKLQVIVAGENVTHPVGTWAGIIENTIDNTSNYGLLVANRYSAAESYILNAGTYWNGSSNTFTSRFVIKGDGNVGIGTTVPTHALDVVSSGVKSPINMIGGSGVFETWKDSQPSYAAAYGLAVPSTAAGNDIQFSTYKFGESWNSRMTILNNGNVGIGTTKPYYKADITGDLRIQSANYLRFGGTTGAGTDYFYSPSSGTIETASILKSTIATGTAPLIVSSSTKVYKLNVANADSLGGNPASLFSHVGHTHPGLGTGTVTSVSLIMPSGFTVSGSPVTGEGTFTVSGTPWTTSNTSGNAGSATKLATAREINGVTFDGSAAITITAAASDVYDWAKASIKPTYTYSEVGALAAGGKAANASLLNGVAESISAVANTIVKRDKNNYINTAYLYCSRGDETSTAASYLYDSGDGLARKKTLANTKAEIVTSAAVIAGLGYQPDITAIPSSDHSFSGQSIPLTAGIATEFGDAVYINSSGNAVFCNATAIATCPYCLAIAGASIASGSAGYYVLQGTLKDASWSWTTGGIIYISTTGVARSTLTQTIPTGTNNVIMPVGVALSATSMYFFGNINSVERQ